MTLAWGILIWLRLDCMWKGLLSTCSSYCFTLDVCLHQIQKQQRARARCIRFSWLRLGACHHHLAQAHSFVFLTPTLGVVMISTLGKHLLLCWWRPKKLSPQHGMTFITVACQRKTHVDCVWVCPFCVKCFLSCVFPLHVHVPKSWRTAKSSPIGVLPRQERHRHQLIRFHNQYPFHSKRSFSCRHVHGCNLGVRLPS